MTPTPQEINEAAALIRLRERPGVSDRRLLLLVEAAGSGVKALEAQGEQVDLLGEPTSPAPVSTWVHEGMDVIPLTSRRYPCRLKELTDPPPVLFLRGDESLLSRPAVAIVGSRRATGVGRRAAETMARALAGAGVTVVSGMALGIDGASHRGALEGPGSTVAVLGSGLRVIYPASHRPLFLDISRRGLLLTEFLPSEKALPHHFPKRNRIIAALVSAVIVVEAAERSGALITVDHALDLGRDVFAIPGSVENPQAVGSNALLKEGARVLPRPEAVVEEMQESGLLFELRDSGVSSSPSSGAGVPPELVKVWETLTTEPMEAQEVAELTELPLAQALAGLSSLELGGWALRCPGMRFRRA